MTMVPRRDAFVGDQEQDQSVSRCLSEKGYVLAIIKNLQFIKRKRMGALAVLVYKR